MGTPRRTRTPQTVANTLNAIGKLLLGEEQLRYVAIEADLRNLLKEFGPWRENYRPQDPFWRLKNARNLAVVKSCRCALRLIVEIKACGLLEVPICEACSIPPIPCLFSC